MDRVATSLLLYVIAANLGVSAVTHLMPLVGGRPLNPVPAWAGGSTFVWELAIAWLVALAALLVQPPEEGAGGHGRKKPPGAGSR